MVCSINHADNFMVVLRSDEKSFCVCVDFNNRPFVINVKNLILRCLTHKIYLCKTLFIL